jgi:cold shock CspA family protein
MLSVRNLHGGVVMAQGTVKHFDAGTRSGSVLLDDGTEIPLGAEAFDRSGLLMLRFGQRVRFELSGPADEPFVSSIDVVTMSR